MYQHDYVHVDRNPTWGCVHSPASLVPLASALGLYGLSRRGAMLQCDCVQWPAMAAIGLRRIYRISIAPAIEQLMAFYRSRI